MLNWAPCNTEISSKCCPSQHVPPQCWDLFYTKRDPTRSCVRQLGGLDRPTLVAMAMSTSCWVVLRSRCEGVAKPRVGV